MIGVQRFIAELLNVNEIQCMPDANDCDAG